MANLDPGGGYDPLAALVGIKLAHTFAGLAGGLVRALTRSDQSWSRRVTISIAGGLTAGWCTPTVAPIVAAIFDAARYPAAGIEGSVGFGLGLIGLSAADLMLGWARRWLDRLSPPGPPPAG